MYYTGMMIKKITQELDEVTFEGKTITKNPRKKNIKKGDVEGYFLSKSRIFVGGGAYIPCPKEFANKKSVCVIVLKKGEKK